MSSAAEHDIQIKDHWFKYSDFTIEDGYRKANEILASGDLPTAIFCANDYIAAGAIRAILLAGLKVPDDISIIGFDDVDVARACFPRLTTLRQPLLEHGRLSASLLLDLINGNEPANRNITMEPELIERESVQSIPIQTGSTIPQQ